MEKNSKYSKINHCSLEGKRETGTKISRWTAITKLEIYATEMSLKLLKCNKFKAAVPCWCCYFAHFYG